MRSNSARIVSMQIKHIRICREIAACSEPWRTLKEGIDFLHYISRKEAYVFMSGDEPAGFIIFTPLPVFARGGYLRAIGVSPSMRRHGIGKGLMDFAEKKTSRSALNFYLCVSSFNRPAQAFYKSLGYIRIGKVPELIMPGSSECIYWKRLRPFLPKRRRT